MTISFMPSGNAENLIAQAKGLYDEENAIATVASTNLSIVSNFKLAIGYDLLNAMKEPLDLSGMDWNSRARDAIDPAVSNLNLANEISADSLDATFGKAKDNYSQLGDLKN